MRIIKMINDSIWNVRLEDINPFAAFFVKQLRIVLIVLKNYTKDNLQLQAAGLTFYTMLSVVPIVALAFAISKGFGFEKTLEEELTTALKGHEEVVEQIMTFASRMLENTKGGLLAGVGVVILLWTVMQLLSNVELSFNEIWQVGKGRTWLRKITDYFVIMLFAPILVILAGSMTVVISGQLENLVTGYDFLQTIGPFIHFLVRMIPYTLIWLLFTFVYMIMPNTKVSFKSALVAGIIAGTSFQLLEWVYINFQVGVSRYNAIYGSFAALPLFMIWVNTSWLITLVGAEVAYANQYVTEIKNEIDGGKLSSSQRHIIALLLLRNISVRFENGEDAPRSKDLSTSLSLPFGVTARVLELMIDARLIYEVEANDKEDSGFLPHRSIDKVYVSDVLTALDGLGYTEISMMKDAVYNLYFDRYDSLQQVMKNSSENTLVKDLPAINIHEELS
ncbi:YihY/virulence factor BrkB family protein [Salibacteraceae bacterium]|jgi:membrane protein|nr:YihY/virulence factor BrkB family protein [Salibacteraceae bacterium]HAQ70373.1 YihY/virulence factor BrkB family protein [Flavobacteriales bacterium]